MYLTQQEIFSQHLALAQTQDYFKNMRQEIEGFFARYQGRKVIFMGCGSSYMLSQSAQAVFAGSGTDSAAVAGGEYLVHPEQYQALLTDSIVVILSRSGLTSEVVRGAELIRSSTNAALASVTMKEQNDLLPFCELNLILPWAYDDSVCQTRSVSNLYTAVLLLEAFRSGDSVLESSVSQAVSRIESFQTENRQRLEALAKLDFDQAIVLADAPVSGIAQEAALAFTEIAMMPGASYPVLDYRHGPIVLHGPKTLTLVAVQPEQGHYQQDLLADLRRTGCILVTVTGGEQIVGEVTEDFRTGELSSPAALGLFLVNAAQIIAFSKALQRGVNPDQPKGLDAYISLK